MASGCTGPLRLIVDAALTVALAPTCAACDAVLDRPTAGCVCEACWNAIHPPVPPLCARCGDSLPSWRTRPDEIALCARCRHALPAFDRACAAGIHEGSLRAIIHAFKYDGRRSLARPLGRLMWDAGGDILDGADVLVPVPLHRWRRMRRGFNQAEDLSRALEARSPRARIVRALRRTRRTRPQADLPPAERQLNVRDAFGLSPRLARRRSGPRIDGATVVLVDDVRTTGATLGACATVLKRAGAREVRVITAAIAITAHKGDADE